jgi:hypothetical protein
MSLHLTSCEYAPPEPPVVKELHVDEDGIEAILEGPVVRIVAEGLFEEFRNASGVNYVEWNISVPGEGYFTLTMQRVGASTPGKLAAERAVRIAELEALLEARA